MRTAMWAFCLALAASGCLAWSVVAPSPPGDGPVLLRIEPSTAAVGDAITVTGRGFTATGNALKIGAGYTPGISTTDSTRLELTLPEYLVACPPDQQVCVALALPLPPGNYQVSVVNRHGTSNALPLVIAEKK